VIEAATIRTPGEWLRHMEGMDAIDVQEPARRFVERSLAARDAELDWWRDRANRLAPEET
jgi:hypothetical protein